jgi:hypothetical protein
LREPGKQTWDRAGLTSPALRPSYHDDAMKNHLAGLTVTQSSNRTGQTSSFQ